MFGVRVHGRAGQGVATTAQLLSVAAFRSGQYAQAFPGHQPGSAPGVPVVAFCRIDSKPLLTREPVTRADALLIGDPALLADDETLAGLGQEGYMLINSSQGLGELGLCDRVSHLCRDRILVVPASRLVFAHLGRLLPGAALLGGLAALTGQISLGHVVAALHERFGQQVADANEAGARDGYEFARAEREALAGT